MNTQQKPFVPNNIQTNQPKPLTGNQPMSPNNNQTKPLTGNQPMSPNNNQPMSPNNNQPKPLTGNQINKSKTEIVIVNKRPIGTHYKKYESDGQGQDLFMLKVLGSRVEDLMRGIETGSLHLDDKKTLDTKTLKEFKEQFPDVDWNSHLIFKYSSEKGKFYAFVPRIPFGILLMLSIDILALAPYNSLTHEEALSQFISQMTSNDKKENERYKCMKEVYGKTGVYKLVSTSNKPPADKPPTDTTVA